MTPIAVDVETAAEMIGVSVTVLRAYIDSGILPAVKLPSTTRVADRSRRVLIAVDDLKEFVARHRVARDAR